jgi:hypothetical protein
MQQVLPELLRLNVPFIFLIGICAISVVTAFWLYRKTVPSVNSRIKYILGGIRAIVVFLVILLFFAPRFFLTYNEKQSPQIAVFVDNSLSMGFKEADYDRWRETLAVVQQVKEIIPDNVITSWYQFNSVVETMEADSIKKSNAGTNFNCLIKSIQNNNFDKAVIISDGNNTEGGYPFNNDWTPKAEIYTIGIGKITEDKDVFVADVFYQPIAYQGQKQKVEVQVGSKNINKKRRISVKLISNKKILSTKVIETSAANSEQSVFFEYIPKKTGLNKIKISLDVIKGEVNSLNNNFVFVQDILKSKLRIGIFAGLPGYESKFIKLLLEQRKDFEINYYVENKQGQFFLNPDLRIIDSLDIFIFQDYPGPFTKSAVLNQILANFKKRNPALIVFLGNKTNTNLLKNFSQYLPYSQLPNPIQTYQVSVSSAPLSQISPVLHLFERSDLNVQFWNKIPPVNIHFAGGKLKKESKVLIEGSVNNKRYPLAILYDEKNIKAVLFNGGGFWKWHFLLQDQVEYKNGYCTLLNHLVRWVSNKSKIKPVLLETAQKVVHLGEKISLTGHLYDADYKPILDGGIILQADWNKQRFTIETINDSSGNYLAEFVPPGQGRYVISAKGFKDGAELGVDRLQIEVIPFEKEFIRIEQNAGFLKKTAKMGHGFYVTSDSVDSLSKALSVKAEIIQKDKIIEIWYAPALLFLIIALITLEWILRKRYGLV